MTPDRKKTTQWELLIRIDERLQGLEKAFHSFKDSIKDNYVKHEDFAVLKQQVDNNVKIRNLLVGGVLMSFLAALWALIIK